jgi:hypothetical protein
VSSSTSISNHPQDITLCAGSNHTFSVTASGSGLTYQWEESTNGGGSYAPVNNGGIYSGATSANLTLTGITAGMNNYRYRVVVTGAGACAAPVTSNAAILSVVSSVNITSHPASQTICAGSNTSFTVAGSGGGIVYLWEVSTDGGAIWNTVNDGGVYSGATTATLTITGAPASMNNYRYRARLSNSTCPTPGVSNTAILTVNTGPAISTHPVNSTICLGSNTSFTSTASGTGISYLWQLSTDGGVNWGPVANGGVYSGATTATLTITGATASMNNYRYRLQVSGTCPPPALSNAAILTVVNPAVIATHPVNAEICSGNNAVFTVTGTSTETIIYQWEVSTNGGTSYSDIPGANSASYTVTGAPFLMNNNRYRVRISNASCPTAAVSNAAILTVRQLPTVSLTASPLTSLLPGQTTTLTAGTGASTGGVLVTTWLFNGAASSPAITGNSYVVGIDKIGTYQVSVNETWPSGLFCSALSQPVTISATASTRLFIFPSPNDGRFTVSYYNSAGTSTQRTIVIFDGKGSKVYSRMFTITGPYTLLPIDLRNVNTGIYYVAVGDASGQKLADGKVHIR